MTDITDQDRRAYEWAQMAADNNADPSEASWRIVARHYLVTVKAPAPTLAEAMRTWAAATALNFGEEASFDPLIARAEQIEQERNSLEQQRDYWCDSERQAVKDRDHLAAEIDKANTDILHLTAERDEARAEVERLTAENENLRKTDNYREFREQFLAVQKGAESTAETPDPADVKPGETWLVRDEQELSVAVRDAERWVLIHLNDATTRYRRIQHITLITRLVPAPRVITNPDELGRAKRLTVIRDGVGVVCERASLGDEWYTTGNGVDQTPYITFPVTVLWEPGA